MRTLGRHVRPLPVILLLAAGLHALGVARASLPAQDGLKFIAVARDFQTRPWLDVVRGTDRHPLYPALVALAEPAVRASMGPGPDAWRVAGQLVAAVASVLLLVPLHGLARRLFNRRAADLTALGFVLLPLPMGVGHDTLSDSLALGAFVLGLRLGLEALSAGRLDATVGCGLSAGVGFLARPEALVTPLAVVLAGGALAIARVGCAWRVAAPRLAGVGLTFLVVVGGYALAKGDVSEKLALRSAASLVSRSAESPTVVRLKAHSLPLGLDGPGWDFSPKEEPAGPPQVTVPGVAADVAKRWSEGMGVALAPLAVWGLFADLRTRRDDRRRVGRWLVLAYLGLFGLVLVRHELRMGYLSDRHVLTLVVLGLPWAAHGALDVRRRTRPRRGLVAAGLAVVLAVSVWQQAKAPHPSRWGHGAAGRWLAANATAGEAVLDTRGWASFVSGLNAYDYWHVRQALTDSRLAYVVVGDDELTAASPRAATLRSLLAFAGEPAAAFPSREGGAGVGVWVYRFDRPASWEGMRP